MQMIFSGAGIGGSQVIASRAWSGERRCGSLGQFCQRAGGDRFAQRRIFLAKLRGEIDDPAFDHSAVFRRSVDRVSSKAGRGHQLFQYGQHISRQS